MSAFDNRMTDHQTKWREANIGYPEWGEQNGRQYEWVLPKDRWKDGLWDRIRSGVWSLPAYLRDHNVGRHSGAHNLKSSWILCANLYFPSGQSVEGRQLLTDFLRGLVHPAIETVDKLELEYAETDHLHPAQLLGEVDGRRGAGQTSPDVAFVVNGCRGLVLTEVKFTEHSFYRCSARTLSGTPGKPGNPDLTRCNDVAKILRNPAEQCHQSAWGRKYWEHLVPVIEHEMLSGRCPAANSGYQLFRQQALAEGIAESGKYDLVVSAVAMDQRNDALRGCLKSLGIDDVRQWGGQFNGKAAHSDDFGRAFRLMSATHSDRSRPAVPIDVGRGGGAPAGWL